MVFHKQKPRHFKKSVFMLMLAACLLSGTNLCYGYTPGNDTPTSGTSAAVGDTTITVKKNGNIEITMTATTATNAWVWRTVGYYITDKKVAVDASTLSGAAGSGTAYPIYVQGGWKCKCPGCPNKGSLDGEVDNTERNGTTTTVVTVKKEVFNAHRKAAGVSLADGSAQTLYLQGVLAFYYGGTYKYGLFYSVNQAKAKNRALGGGKDWGFYPRSSGEGWVKRYNIPISYQADPTNVYIQYYRKNTKAELEAGAAATWSLVSSYSTQNNDEKWTDTTDAFASLRAGNGLGFSKGVYYEGQRVDFTKYNTPRLLSQIAGGDTYEQYYLYRVSWSKKSDTASAATGVRKQNGSYVYTDSILDSAGEVTAGYIAWLKSVREQYFRCASAEDGMILNVFYKKAAKAKTEEEAGTPSADTHMTPCASAVIQSDSRGVDTALDLETYDSTEGIPSSEPQYVNVYADNYLFTVGYTTSSASKTYSYHEGCYYVPPDEEAGTSGYWVHGHGSMTITCTWEDIAYLGIWEIQKADITNKSLPDGTETLYPHDYSIDAPDVVYTGRVVRWSPYGTAPCGANGAPDPSASICQSARLAFQGKTVLSDAKRSLNGDTHAAFPQPETIGNDVLYEHGYVIPATLANKEYASKGKVTYRAVVNVNTGSSSELSYTIKKINDVTVHTPTVSYPSFIEEAPYGTKPYCQLVDPDDSVTQLVLDRYFKVKDSSYGYHTSLRGYGTREYSPSVNKFIAKKEVRFPFDVYGLNEDGKVSSSLFYPAGTWIELDLLSGEGGFYLPTWVGEGAYTVEFRSRAINCDANAGTDEDALDAVTEATANTDLSNYAASSTMEVNVSGRLFGLQMYDNSDYPIWGERIFRVEGSTALTGLSYTVGLKDRNGNVYRSAESEKYTFALVNGSHPYLNNYGVMKPGYVQRFQVTTFGDMSQDDDYVEITPTFYYVPYDGSSIQEVDVYYDETIDGALEHFVKVGSARDLKNVKTMSIGDLYASVPDSAISRKAEILGVSEGEVKALAGASYTYGKITVPMSSCTFVGEHYVPGSGPVPDGVDADTVARSAQKWYFEYSLPATVYAVAKGTTIEAGRQSLTVDEYASRYGIDYSEDFWCKNGYILVNWEIKSVDGDRAYAGAGTEGEAISAGEAGGYHLSYINHGNWLNGYCNMWNMEGFSYTKTDADGNTFTFRDGDVLMYYSSGKTSGSGGSSGSVKNDYTSRGTH
jgi:hypothetical protein